MMNQMIIRENATTLSIALVSASRLARANTRNRNEGLKTLEPHVAIVPMDVLELFVLIGTVVNLTALVLGVLFRKRILRALGRLIFTGAIEFVQGTYFDEVVAKGEDGEKVSLARPNARAEAFLTRYGPPLVGFVSDWARKNVKIKLPPFELPEGLDLKQVGISTLATKAMSGKKLKLDDAVPLLLGYAKDWADKSGILETIAGKKKEVKPSETATVGRITR